MRQTTIIYALALLIGTAMAAPTTTVTLTDGRTITGQLTPQQGGLFLHTHHGGKLIRWEQLQPSSLTPQHRAHARQQTLAILARAHAILQGGRADLAAPLYSQILQRAWYLHYADWETPPMRHIHYHAQAWVNHQGTWMPFARRQQLAGLVHLDGHWLTPDQAAQYAVFKTAFAKARKLSPDQAILLLQTITQTYPDSIYRPAADRLRDQLQDQLQDQLTASQKRQADADDPGTPSYAGFIDRTETRYDHDWYSTYGRPTYIYDQTGLRLIYKTTNSYRHQRQKKHRQTPILKIEF